MLRFILLLCCLLLTHPAKAHDLLSFIKDSQPQSWLNVERPVTAADLKDRAVLLDFWTYGCINCMQIVPDLEYLEHKYGNGLLIIGVHSAKFKGEQGSSRILAAAKRFGLKHPVYNDSDFGVWNSFAVKAWPTQILIGPDGKEVARYQGEGHRAEIDKALAGLDLKNNATPVPVSSENDKKILSFPARVFADQTGKLFIADSGHNRILKTDPSGKILAAIGSGSRGDKDGDFKSAQFSNPRGFSVSGDKIYIADTGNHKLRMADLKTGQVTTLLGDGKRGQKGELASPWNVAVFGDYLMVANAGTHQLLSYDLTTRKLSVFAGNGREDLKDGPALNAKLAQPSDLNFGGVDAWYFIDAESSSLRVVFNDKVQTLIGTGLFDFGLKDGKYPQALLQHPQGFAVTGGKIYIADTYNDAIRVYDQKSATLSTLKIQTELNEPGDIFVSLDHAYIADTNNNRILRLDLVKGQAQPVDIRN